MTTPINLETALKLCLLETRCPCICHRNLDVNHIGPQCSCNDTGRIPLLDPKLVRVECPSRYDRHWHKTVYTAPGTCKNWTPSTDPWAYVRAAWPLVVDKQWFVLQAVEQSLNRLSVETGAPAPLDPGPAAFDVVAKALLKEKP